MAATARLRMYVKVHNLFCTIQDAPWHELDNKSLLEVGVDATEFQHRLHSSQPFFRPLPLDQLHLLSNIRPKINFEPWSGGDWSFSDRLIDVGLRLRSLFAEQLGRSLEVDSLIQTSVWQTLGQFTPGQTKHLQEYDTTFFRDPLPGQYEWHVNDIYIADDSPHMMAIHLDSRQNRSGLLRGELLSLLGIMRDRLKYPDIESHLIIPVLILSIRAKNARLVMGHFDGTRLVVQYSPDMDFSTYNKQDLDTVLQWMLSTPCGDTTSASLAAELNKMSTPPLVWEHTTSSHAYVRWGPKPTERNIKMEMEQAF